MSELVEYKGKHYDLSKLHDMYSYVSGSLDNKRLSVLEKIYNIANDSPHKMYIRLLTENRQLKDNIKQLHEMQDEYKRENQKLKEDSEKSLAALKQLRPAIHEHIDASVIIKEDHKRLKAENEKLKEENRKYSQLKDQLCTVSRMHNEKLNEVNKLKARWEKLREAISKEEERHSRNEDGISCKYNFYSEQECHQILEFMDDIESEEK